MSGGGGSQPKSSTTVQKSEPWSGAKPYLEDVYQGAEQLYNKGDMTPFGTQDPAERLRRATQYLGFNPAERKDAYGAGQGLSNAITSGQAGFTPDQLAAFNQQRQLAGSSISPAYSAAQQALTQQMQGGGLNPQGLEAAGYYQSTLAGQTAPSKMMKETASGAFLGANPYLDAQYQAMVRPAQQAFMTSVMPSIEGNFARSGRYGSDAMAFNQQTAAEGFGRQLSDSAAQLYGGAYEAERGRMEQARSALGQLTGQAAQGLAGIGDAGSQRMLQAAGLTPQVADAGYQAQLARTQLLGGIGGEQQAMQQALADRVAALYGQQNQAPYSQLGYYADIVGGLPSSSMASQTGSAPGAYQGSRMAGAAGGAASGAAVGSAIMPGWGTAVGAGVGGLMGLFA